MSNNSTSGSWIAENLPEDVKYGFSRAGLRRLRSLLHPNPLSRGLHLNYMENWPGLTFSDVRGVSGGFLLPIRGPK